MGLRITAAMVALTLAAGPAGAVDYAGPQFDVYDVAGDAAEIARQMAAAVHTPDGPHYATTVYRIDYTLRLRRDAGGGCRVDTAQVRLAVTVRLPRLAPGPATPPAVARRWESFAPALRRHEMGHVALAAAGADGLETQLAHLPPQPDCAQAERVARAEAQRVLAALRLAQRDYDRRTDHGRTQGATFP